MAESSAVPTTIPAAVTPESNAPSPEKPLKKHPLTGAPIEEEKLQALINWAMQPAQVGNNTESPLGGLTEYVEAGAIAFYDTNQMQNVLLSSVKRRIEVKRGITVNRQQNAQAAQAYMRGDAANPPCISCSKGSGPFPICVTVADSLRGACASCHYGGEGSRCSFRKPRKFTQYLQKTCTNSNRRKRR